jgi:cytochrome oxidase Cu insertion factor (SCO1/SenC/PrrC family)
VVVLSFVARLTQSHPGTVVVLLSSRTATHVKALPLAFHGAGGWRQLPPVTAAIAAAPESTQVAEVDVPAGDYDAVRLGSSESQGGFTVREGKVEPLLLAVSGRSLAPGGVYAGNEAVNLGLGEIAGRYTPLPAFTLEDQHGVRVTDADLRGAPTVIAAFHTTCRATCPLYTGLLLQLERQRGGAGVHLVEVTTDPGDSPSTLAAYAKRVRASWEFLTGTADQLAAFWAPLQVQLSTEDAHASTLAIADSHGYLRLVYRGVPDLATLPPALAGQLDPLGLSQLGHGDGWGSSEVLASLKTVEDLFQPVRTVSGPAPRFRLPLLNGGTASLAALQGQPVVVSFWASYCTVCTTELPQLVEAAQRQPGLVLLLVDERDDPNAARSFLAALRLHPLNALDADGKVGGEYGVSGLPATFFVRADGTLAGAYLGQIDAATMAAKMSELTAQ